MYVRTCRRRLGSDTSRSLDTTGAAKTQTDCSRTDAFGATLLSLTQIIVAAVTRKTTYPTALELAYSFLNWGAAG